jgi:hypothetical protein
VHQQWHRNISNFNFLKIADPIKTATINDNFDGIKTGPFFSTQETTVSLSLIV